MKRITSLFALTIVCLVSFAQQVSIQEAEKAANAFLRAQDRNVVRCAKTVESELGTLLYIFNAENAFVVVSGDKSSQPVLAYIDNQLYNDSDVIPPFEMWLDNYANQISKIKRMGITQKYYADKWNSILQGEVCRNGAEVQPLMLSHWDQGEYYNYYCPRDGNGPNGRVVTGCVATAMAQLIYYFRFPETGIGSYSYVDEHYGEQSANYGETHYDYNAMCDDPTSINPEISKLIYHCGVGVDMVYGPNGSGMYNHSAAKVLRTYFKYSPETRYLFRDSTDLDWDSVIVSHLSRQIPMYYAGWSVPNINGHGFICDGYKTVDDDYYFHFNFGWSGDMDGYFYTNSLYVGGSNFNLAQELIINAYPDTDLYEYPVAEPENGVMTFTAGQGTFTDGSQTSAFYSKNRNFTWNIVPEVSNLQSISLKVDYNLAAGDSLILSSDNPVMRQIITDTGSVDITWLTDNMSLQLITDDTLESFGFRATYTADQEIFCSGSKAFTSAQGHIDDGSGDDNYNNFTTCKFAIVLPAYTAIILNINYLDLEENHDFLRIYKNTAITDDNLLLTLTGQKSDTTIIFDNKRLNIILETDETGTANGFDMDYYGSHVGIENYDDMTSIYPNPVRDNIFISSEFPVEKVEVFNAEGRTLFVGEHYPTSFSVDTKHYSPGIYTVRVYSEGHVVTRKVVKF